MIAAALSLWCPGSAQNKGTSLPSWGCCKGLGLSAHCVLAGQGLSQTNPLPLALPRA